MSDPFFHHPELRNKIADPETSFFRDFSLDALADRLRALGCETVWFHTDEEREASRREALRGHRGDDLWIFAYGSLMWDPAVRFAEVRRARVPDYSRQFILKDIHGGRGTRQSPGLMAALDAGGNCDGLAFRIEHANIEAETRFLWQREKLGPAYTPTFVETQVGGMPVDALTFVADHGSALIDTSLTRQDQIRYLATGTGVLGSSINYIRNIASHFETLGIRDDELTELLREVERYAASQEHIGV